MAVNIVIEISGIESAAGNIGRLFSGVVWISSVDGGERLAHCESKLSLVRLFRMM